MAGPARTTLLGLKSSLETTSVVGFFFDFVRVGEGGGLYSHAAQMLLYDPGVKRCGAWHSIADQSPIDYY